jgi:hypothetical protein
MKRLFENIGKTDIRNIISVVIVFGCFSLLGVMLLKAIPTDNKDIVLTAIGFVFGSGMSGVTGYYFGSTKNDKNEK